MQHLDIEVVLSHIRMLACVVPPVAGNPIIADEAQVIWSIQDRFCMETTDSVRFMIAAAIAAGVIHRLAPSFLVIV